MNLGVAFYSIGFLVCAGMFLRCYRDWLDKEHWLDLVLIQAFAVVAIYDLVHLIGLLARV